MSASPTRYQQSQPPSAEIRSLAIAKLKRAASLPRTPDGRRQAQGQPRAAGGPSAPPSEEASATASSSQDSHGMTPSPTKGTGSNALYGDEEFLASSPAGHHVFGSGGATMQRSASDGSSFQIPTPPHVAYGSANASPFFTAQASPASTPGTDWAAYQLAQSYLPSISPVPPTNPAAPPSSFPANLTTPGGGGGRNTPSPLPSLGELRNLSRSNSAAARQNAMNKLIGGGGAATPTKSRNVGAILSSSEEDVTLSLPATNRSAALHRSGTIGVPRMFGMPAETAVDDTTVTDIPDTALDVPRPRLQRSFTVSSSNMGEERRSAVGRRMVERLGARRAARQQEESEVRQLWEERRRTRGSQKGIDLSTPDGTPPRPAASVTPPTSTPAKAPPPPPPPSFAGLAAGGGVAGLLAANLAARRTPSRSTQRSDDVFEYEAHLNRSMSTRTHRTDLTDGVDGSEASTSPAMFEEGQIGGEHGADDPTPLEIPELPFTTPTKHVGNESISSSATTVLGPKGLSPAMSGLDRVPSSESADPFNSYPTGQQNGSMYSDEKQPHGLQRHANGNGDAGNGRATARRNFPHQADHSVPLVDTSEAARGRDAEVADSYYSEGRDIRPGSNASAQESLSNSGHGEAWEPRHRKKTSSISKLGRAMFNAAKPRISMGSSDTPPLSPRGSLRSGGGSRRPSDASNSQSQHSLHSQYSQRGVSPAPRGVSPAPELNSGSGRFGKLTPPLAYGAPKSPVYKKDEPTDQANSMLIQHQLSGAAAPSPISFLPRPNLNDPRINNSKLSPFPGIAALESRSRRPSEEQPRLIQQTSDPTLPTARALSPHADTGRGSNDSGSKRKHNLPMGSVSSHGSTSAHGTTSSFSHSNGNGYDGNHSRGLSHSQSDDRHGREDASVKNDILRAGAKQRPEIPASFMVNRRRAPPPPIEVADSNVVSINDDPVTPPSSKFGNLPPRSREVLRRMDGVLALPANDPLRPDFLDDPPRKLLLSQQVLQVVNKDTVKDRYLLLFNDLLVIARPIMPAGTTTANLGMKFIVKSIVSLDKLVVTGVGEESHTEPARHPTVQQFIHDFAEDAVRAVHHLVEPSNPRLDTATLANLLFKTHELDKTQLGVLLASDPNLLLSFVEQFDFDHVRIDEALRQFLLAVRLPTDISAAEAVLRGFADGYSSANEAHLPYDMALAEDLVVATLELNDMLYSTFGFAFPNHAVSRETFVSAFVSKDPQGLVPRDLLDAIFTSIRNGKLLQGLSSHDVHQAREIVQTPARLPGRLVYNEWSEVFRLSLPGPDPNFTLKLAGAGLELDPPVLDFSQSREVAFRIRGTRLGRQTLLFRRQGPNAALYPGFGNSHSFTVERPFMRHTFHVSFVAGGLKKKYCFSVPEAALRSKWGMALNRQISLATARKAAQISGPASKKPEGRVQRASEAVALQVLRDAVLDKSGGSEDTGLNSYSNATSSNSHGNSNTNSTSNLPSTKTRKGSVSVAYAPAGEEGPGSVPPIRSTGMGTGLQTGKELVLLCRQNSLLPAVLELLQKGTGSSSSHTKSASNSSAGSHSKNSTLAHNLAQGQSPVKGTAMPPEVQALSPPRAEHLHTTEKPKRSAGLRAMMHDRRL